ncbi:MAG: tetratricopeptide repeat protein [Gemmatimonadetes bacterium]|nr:tetratricopeptide repeat protein [Gemmatimonadota bacterium]
MSEKRKAAESFTSSGSVELSSIPDRKPAGEVTGPVSFNDAEAAYEQKQFDDAVKLFKGYTTQKPENAWGHYMLGLSAWKTRDFGQAESEFLRALELDPTHVRSRYNLARVYLDQEEPAKAAEQIESALKIDSTSAEGFRLLGRARDELGLLKEAEQAYREALKRDNRDFWSMNNLGLNFISQDRAGEAVGVLSRAVQLQPEKALFRNNLGMALELNGYFVDAGKAYQAAVEKDSSYQKAIDNLARVSGHEDKPGLPPLDLDVLAQNFVGEIYGWRVSQN